MRRIITALLAAILTLALCACGTAPTPPAAEAPVQDAPAATEAPAAESAASEGYTQLRIGMECAYAPSNWQETAASDTNLPIENVPGTFAEGYDVQIARRICEQVGAEPVIVMLAWDGLIEALNQGQIDLIIAGMADTATRREAINFSDPYHATEYGIMVNSGSAFEGATSIQDFAGASILGQKDTQLDAVIDQIEGVEHLTPVASVPNMISRLQEGTCDGIVINMENAAGYMEMDPNFVAIGFEEGAGFDLGFTGSCVGIRFSDEQLLADVNAALATIDQATRDTLWNTAVENQPT